jgi:copper chaperone CopZ
MKKLVFLYTLVVVFLFVNCNQSSVDSGAIVEADQELALKVEGMVCAVGCAKYIENELSKFSGVSHCTVNFEEGTAMVDFSSEVLSQEEIVEVINNLSDGQYQATVISQKKMPKTNESMPQENKEKESSMTEVSFQFPQLVTYFINRLVR